MSHKKNDHGRGSDDAALAAEAARLKAKEVLDDSNAVESAALSDVALTGANVDAVAKTEPPAWVLAAKMLCPRASDGNGAWHDFFKEALPSTPASTWTGPDAVYSYYAGGRVLVAYPTGFFAVMTTPALEKPKAGFVGPGGLTL